MALTRSSWATLKFETPAKRIFPAFTASAMTVQASSIFASDRPMDLIEIVAIGAERLRLASISFRTLSASRFAWDRDFPPATPSALRGEEDLVSTAFDRPADDLLGVTEAVDRGRVDPVDSEIETRRSGNRILVVWAPQRNAIIASKANDRSRSS
jgi:hypothetical protein